MWTTKPHPSICPECGHYYIDWLNYRETYGKLSMEELYGLSQQEKGTQEIGVNYEYKNS